MGTGQLLGSSNASPARAGKIWWRGRWLRAGLITAGLSLFALLGGFFGFVHSLQRIETASLPKVDGIVALTGGVERIPDAVSWLAQGHGERLLISGVAPQISADQLARTAPMLKNWLHCCVDLDHDARNTVGNAAETRRWALAKGYRSLVIVTSSYHMPRAMIELHRQLPEVALIPAPVVTERLQGMEYWRDGALLKTLFHEYGKFLVSFARSRLTTPYRSDDISASTPRRRA